MSELTAQLLSALLELTEPQPDLDEIGAFIERALEIASEEDGGPQEPIGDTAPTYRYEDERLPNGTILRRPVLVSL